MSDLKTLPQLAKEFGITERRCDYAAKSHGIEPTERLGIIRLYDRTAAEKIREAVTLIASRREAVNA